MDIRNWSNEKFGNQRIGVALIGMGRMGLIPIKNLLREPRAKLLYCVDSDHTRLATLSKSMLFHEFGIRALHHDELEVALRDPAVSAVLIATPTNQHQQQATRALEAGKSAMCEKPLTPLTESIMPLHYLGQGQEGVPTDGVQSSLRPGLPSNEAQCKVRFHWISANGSRYRARLHTAAHELCAREQWPLS